MAYLLVFLMLVSGYYTLTYGIFVFKEDNNKLGGYAAIAIALIGTLLPIFILFVKQIY